MYIVALAWIYVILMMAITENSVTAGVMTFLFYGVLPIMIILYLMGTPQRRRNRQREREAAMAARNDSVNASVLHEARGEDDASKTSPQ